MRALPVAAFLLLLAGAASATVIIADACQDGTPFGSCSAEKPKFCSNGNLISRCQQCGCDAALACNVSSGGCVEPPPISISILHPLESEEVQAGGAIRVAGSINFMPRGSALEIDDSRFFLRTLDPPSGSFEFANRTPLVPGPITLKVTLRNQAGSQLASEIRSFTIAGSAPQPGGGMRWELIILVILLGVVAFALLEFGQQALFGNPRQAVPRMPLSRGDVVLVEGPIGSRKEEFCLSHLREELKKGNRCAVVSYQPEKEAAWFAEPERRSLLLAKAEPEINEMAIAVSNMLEDRPAVAYFDILYGLSPKYKARELTAFLEATIKKLKVKGVTGIFTIEKDMLSQQDLSAVESLFDGVSEFDVRAVPGKVKVYYRIKEFKLRDVSQDWMEYA